MNLAKSDIFFYMSVYKDDLEQPDWNSLTDEMKTWMEKSGFKVSVVSNRVNEDYRILEMRGTK